MLSVHRERWMSITEHYQDPVPATMPFWPKPVSILGLVLIDVYRAFASAHHPIHPAPSPPDAGRDTVPSRCRCQSVTVGTVSAGSVRVVAFPHICVGYC